MGMIDRIKKRRKARKNAKKPRQQFYGGSKEEAAKIRERNQAGIDAAGAQEEAGLQQMDRERMLAGGDLRQLSAQSQSERDRAGDQYAELEGRLGTERDAARDAYAGLDQSISAERDAGGRAYDQLSAQALGREYLANRQSGQYGGAADASMADYRGGRDAILGGASEIEQLGRGAAGRFSSAADAAFAAATERNQKNALSLAAGRGPGSIRTALATADAGNRMAQLDQQVVRANEMNQLLGLESDALRNAADVRAGVAAKDQSAAEIQARRQEAARTAGADMLRARGDIATANADLGIRSQAARTDVANANANAGQVFEGMRGDAINNNAQLGQNNVANRAGLATTEAEIGMNAAAARQSAGAGARGQFLGAEGAMEGGQLGSNLQFEAGRQQAAQQRGFTGFLSKLTGGLGNIKATADASDMGPGGKLMGQKQAVPY